MGSVCLSSAAILRCTSFSRVQDIVLVIPTALEVIFSTSLVFINTGNDRRHLLLTFEGWVYLILAIIEMLSHIVPTSVRDATVYRSLDIALGVSSFIPIFLYTLFLYLFAQSELLHILPLHIKRIAGLMLIIFIPGMVIANELSSFIGVSHQTIPLNGIAVGFTNHRNEALWTFFTSLSLAVLTCFQAVIFCFAFYRLVLAIISQRNIETRQTDAAHLFKGIGWINAAVKVGAIETVVGFAGGGFVVALIRRVLRLLARALLCIGLAKGMDEVEDFRAVRNELSSAPRPRFRGSHIRQFISNPRMSTFRPLSPTATAFHADRRAPNGLPGMKQFADAKEQRMRQRVTIQFETGAPTLHLRFSSLDLPSTAMIARETKPQFESERELQRARPDSKSSSLYAPSSIGPAEIVTVPQRTLSQRLVRAQLFRTPVTGDTRMGSYRSSTRDTIEAVKELAGEFPPLPQSAQPPAHIPRRAKGDKSPLWDEKSRPPSTVSGVMFARRSFTSEKKKDKHALNIMNDAEKAEVWKPGSPQFIANSPASARSRKLSYHDTKFGPMPIDPFNDDEDDDADAAGVQFPRAPLPLISSTTDLHARENRRLARHFSVPPSLTFEEQNDTSPRQSPAINSSRIATPYEADPFANLGLRTGLREQEQDSPKRTYRNTPEWADSSQSTQSTPASRRMQGLSQFETAEGRHEETPEGNPFIPTLHKSGDQNKSLEELAIPWLKNPKMEEEERRLAHRLPKKTQLARIKTLGSAPERLTPAPVRSHHPKGSFHLQSIRIPPNDAGMVEIVQGSLESAYSGRSVLRDSQVLQIEEGGYEQREV